MLRRAWLLGVLLAFACDEPSKSPGTRLGADAGAQSPAAGGDADAADASFTPPGSDAGGPDHAGADAGAVPDPSDALYQPDELLEVEITLDSADWETLRGEGRSIVDVISGCYLDDDFDYTMMPASVTVDGHRLEHVGVRKKGLLGSLAMQRPSLRVDFNEYEKDQNLFGEKTLTLNNSIQDRSYTHTCMAYAAFEAAGIAAPRCSFAHVSVNGEDLGVYVHVEAIKKPFIARRFGNDDGDLYEGALADFRPDRLAYFQKKTNEEEPLSPELVALSDALTKPDQELLAALAPLLDLDAFMRFWATEALVANGDSYSGNQNNFFIYVHPETRKISFIPWGPDGAYSVSDSFSGKEGQPKSVYAAARLARRLYALPETREKYRATLQKLLDEHWDETALLAEVDRIAAVVGDLAVPDALEVQREFIRNRQAELEKELTGPAPVWPFPESGEISCNPGVATPVSGGFRTRVSPSEKPAPEIAVENGLVVELLQGPLQPIAMFSTASSDAKGSVFALTIFQLDGSLVQLILVAQRTDLAPGEIRFHGFETFGLILAGPDADHLKMQGLISDGSLTLNEFGRATGDFVSGTFEGKLVPLSP